MPSKSRQPDQLCASASFRCAGGLRAVAGARCKGMACSESADFRSAAGQCCSALVVPCKHVTVRVSTQDDSGKSRKQAWSIDDPAFSGLWTSASGEREYDGLGSPLLPRGGVNWAGCVPKVENAPLIQSALRHSVLGV